jgi:hypothetical protein
MAASPLISVAKSPQQLFIDLRALASAKMSECLRNNDFVAPGGANHLLSASLVLLERYANGLVGTSSKCAFSLTCHGSGPKMSPQNRPTNSAPPNETRVLSEFTFQFEGRSS